MINNLYSNIKGSMNCKGCINQYFYLDGTVEVFICNFQNFLDQLTLITINVSIVMVDFKSVYIFLVNDINETNVQQDKIVSNTVHINDGA